MTRILSTHLQHPKYPGFTACCIDENLTITDDRARANCKRCLRILGKGRKRIEVAPVARTAIERTEES